MTFPSLQDCVAGADRVAPVMIGAAVASVAILSVVALTVLALRRTSAAVRHELWVLGTAGVLLLPALSAVLPGWHVVPRFGTVRDTEPTHAVAPANPPVTISPVPAVPHQVSTVDVQPSSTSTGPAALPGVRLTGTPPTVVTMTPSAPTQPPTQATVSIATPVTPAAPVMPADPAVPRSWTFWMVLCWLIGGLLVTGRVVLGHLSLFFLRRRCTKVREGELFNLIERLRGELGIRRPTELLRSPVRAMPMTWGLWRVRVLIPAQAEGWPADQQRDVLLHELGHVRRWDCLTQLLSQAACAVYWFNPLAWAAGQKMQVERERACDDLVLNNGVTASSYAKHLLDSVSSFHTPRLAEAAAVAMARPSTLEVRVRAILDNRLSRGGLSRRSSLAAALVLLAMLAPAASLRAQQDAPQDAPTVSSGSSRRASDESPATRPTTRPPGRSTTRPSSRPTTRPLSERLDELRAMAEPRANTPRSFGGPSIPTLGEGPTCTIDATIYDLRLPGDQIGRLDVDALARSSESAEAFEKALAALGTSRPMYRANQSVRLSGDRVMMGSNVPIITNVRVTDKGQSINTVQYQDIGAIFTLAGRAAPSGGSLDLDLGVEISASSDEGVTIAANMKAPVMRKVTMSHKGPVQPRVPFLVISVDAGSGDKDARAVAYIGRVIVGDPQQPAPR